MAKKKVIKKVITEDNQTIKVKVDKRAEREESKKVEQEILEKAKAKKAIDVFDVEDAPEGKEEVSDIEQEIFEDEEAEFEEEIQEERFYVVPLAKKGFERAPRWKAAKKAMIVLKKFLVQHMKPEGAVYVSQDINERIWERGIKHPPRKIRVRVTKSVDGIVRAYLA
ncbi:MAG: 50S ribosomal protein L31e [Promethearchaeota archaeon]